MEQHQHCPVCSKPMPLDEEFCSVKCREEYGELMDKRKKRRYILFGLVIVFVVLLVLQFFA